MVYDKMSKNVDIKEVGGKAYNLIKLAQIGINIPECFYITTEFFYKFLGENIDLYKRMLKEYSEENREKIIELITKTDFDEELKTEVNSRLVKFNKLAVRSSATDEDGATCSFAGMLESYLNVEKQDVFDAIKKCFISCFSKRVMEYRKNNNLINENISMAVIIMEMVDADFAGVVFTSNPRTNNPDEVYITAVEGLGEAIVSGKENSSDYALNIFNEIVYKNETEFKVEEKLLIEIAKTAKMIEEKDEHRRGLDIEYAVKNNEIYILQSRLITTSSHIDKNKNRTILDNSNIIESYSGVTTPLTYTFAKEVYSKIYHQTLRNFCVSEKAISSIEDDLNNMLYFYENKIYYKLNSWYKMTSLYPGYEKNKRYMENMMGVKTPLEETNGQAKTRLVKIYAKFIYKMLRMKKDSAIFLKRFNEVTGDYRNNKFDGKTNKELINIYETLENEIIDDFTTPIANDMGAMVFYGILTDKVKKKSILNGDGLISKILSKQGNVESVKQTTMLLDLVDEIKKDEKILKIFQEEDNTYLIDELGKNELDIFKKINMYIQKFGARSMEELKLETITLNEDPTFLFNTIKSYLSIDTNENTTVDIIDDSEILNHYKFLEKFLMDKLIKCTKYFIRNRELLRLQRTYIYDIIRNIYLAIGRNLEKEQIIDNYRDIFYLEKKEISDFVNGTEMKNIKSVIHNRKEEYLENKGKEIYERMYFYGDVKKENMIPIYSMQETNSDDTTLKGVAGGGNVKIGIVKYVQEPSEKFEKGYILMAKRTDPGWTILFPMAEAIIIERGSILSHSAVVAREMGKTLVVGVRGLTEKVRDGDKVKVDGINGTIEIIGENNEK